MINNKVPFFSFEAAPESLKQEWRSTFSEVLAGGIFINGPSVTKFESEWSEKIGSRHAIGVGNGLDGLEIGLRALGIGSGDCVAVPAHTFIASWLAIHRTGATPVGIDVDVNGLLDLDLLEESAVKFQAVMPVHMHGAMVDMPRLMSWAKKRSVLVIEDASQAHLATQGGQFAGTLGDVGVFSLYPTKNLGALGDAGIVVTSNHAIASEVRSLANYGSSTHDKYKHDRLGMNSRLDPIQASILSVNLKYLDTWNARRRQISFRYIEAFANSGITVLHSKEVESVRHHFVIQVTNRDEFRKQLDSHGIGTDIHYPRTAADEYYRMTKSPTDTDFQNANLLRRTSISLPLSPWLNAEQIEWVIAAVISTSNQTS
jgi:dTDP-4-amino-4,6-dideoxygalactose transaminase